VVQKNVEVECGMFDTFSYSKISGILYDLAMRTVCDDSIGVFIDFENHISVIFGR